MRILTFLTALLLSPSLFAQVAVSIKPTRSQFIAYEPLNIDVTLRNQSGRELTLSNTSSNNGWIEFVVKNQSGRVVHALSKQSYSPTTIGTGASVKSSFTLNNAYNLSTPGNYSVYAIVRTPQQTMEQGTRSAQAYFTVNRGSATWSTRVGTPGALGNEREYRILESNSGGGTPPQLYVQVEDVMKGHILATYSMGRFLSFRKPVQAIDSSSNLHVLFLATPELYCHTVVTPAGKTISRKYLKSLGSSHPGLVTESNGAVYVSNAALYDPELEKQQNEQFHNLSEIPGGFAQ